MKKKKSPVVRKKAASTAKKSGVKAGKPKVSAIASTKKSAGDATIKPIKPFPIVGIGSSAGGLEAFTELLHHLPNNLGMAYVYIQHLSATHESFLAEILQRKTSMEVLKVEDKMEIKQDHVYVVPAQYFVTINDGKLKLIPRGKENNLHAIDHFLNSIALLYQ